MSPMKRRVTIRAPSTSPTSWNGSAIAAATPRARSSRPNSSSYISDASATKPISAVARNGRLHHSRFSVSIFCTVRQLSANDGAISSVSTTSSLAPVAWRSHRPRIGSLQPEGEHREDDGRDDEDEERHAPAERVGQQAGGQRTDEAADGVRRAVRAEDPLRDSIG